jgi:acyl-CoA synthetase (AMP-forming)/AMP-acid ligase II
VSETFADALDTAADRWPDRDALVIGDRRVTFRSLAEESARIAAGWLDLGVRPGDKVGLYLENGPDWALAFWALSRIGAVVVPLSSRWTASELRNVLGQAELRALLIGDRFRKVDFLRLYEEATRSRSGSGGPPIVVTTALAGRNELVSWRSLRAETLDAALRRRVAAVQSRLRGDDIAVVQFTSGSTAFPKGAMLRQAAMMEYVRDYGALMDISPEDRVLCHMPFFHIAGLNHVLLVPAVQGATMITADAFDAGSALRQLRGERCTVFGGVSTMYLRIADQTDRASEDFAGIEKAWIQGSPRTNRQVQELAAVRGLVSHYGITEMSGATTFGDVRDLLEKRLSNSGRPMPGIETLIADVETGAPVPPGKIGEIWHRGRRIMAGYLGLDRGEWNIDREGWLHTGDLGSFDAEGYLTFEGRLKDMLKVGGENVACTEVEDALMTHSSVKLAAVVGVPDEQLEEVPVAFVELRGDGDTATEALREHCAKTIAQFKLPRRIFVVKALPMTASNKIHKPALRATAMDALGFGASVLKPSREEA